VNDEPPSATEPDLAAALPPALEPVGARVEAGDADASPRAKAPAREGGHVGPGGQGGKIDIVGLSKEYQHGGNTLVVLADVELHLEPGDMVAVLGASGVGKSTFLQILGTLDLPTRGSIVFDGEELTTMGPERLAHFRNRKIGFVFQFHHLLPDFTALENVMMPAIIQRMPRAAARARAIEILDRVGLSRRLTHRPSELSGGEQQRVALARAMVLRPALLLADEPTGNLDRHTGHEIQNLFIELNREHGSTLVVVTHSPDLAKHMPRRLQMIDGGRLVPAEVSA